MQDSKPEQESRDITDKSGEFIRGWLTQLAIGFQIVLGTAGVGISLKAIQDPRNILLKLLDIVGFQVYFWQTRGLDILFICKYNVITMITTIIAVGNSRGIRIPKPILNESGLEDQVELQVKKGEIRIVPVPLNSTSAASTLLLSEKILGVDWNRPEEDEAWASLQ